MFTAPDILKDTDPEVLQSLAKTSSIYCGHHISQDIMKHLSGGGFLCDYS